MSCVKCGGTPRGPFYHRGWSGVLKSCGLNDHGKGDGEHLHYYCICGWDWTGPTKQQELDEDFVAQRAAAQIARDIAAKGEANG